MEEYEEKGRWPKYTQISPFQPPSPLLSPNLRVPNALKKKTEKLLCLFIHCKGFYSLRTFLCFKFSNELVVWSLAQDMEIANVV